jgi:hypothetical protein
LKTENGLSIEKRAGVELVQMMVLVAVVVVVKLIGTIENSYVC